VGGERGGGGGGGSPAGSEGGVGWAFFGARVLLGRGRSRTGRLSV